MSHVPRKRFGQNFLTAPHVITEIIAAIAPQPEDVLVEIGPGLGALTVPLLDTVERLHVIEIDRDLIARLRGRFPGERLSIHAGDVLEFDFASLVAGKPAQQRLRVVGNLPYNISSPLLFRMTDSAGMMRDMHFMLQKEVVDRMVAAPGGPQYGRLSVMLQYRYQMERLLVVPAEAFHPAPKVASALVRMVPRPLSALTVRDPSTFAALVRSAFGQRRKMLRNTLRELIGEPGLVALGISPAARAEELGVEDYVRLANALAS